MEWINQFIGSAEKLGTLSATAVFGLFDIIFIAYIGWDLKGRKQAEEIRLQMRLKDAESDILFAKALEKMADELKEFRYKIQCVGGKND